MALGIAYAGRCGADLLLATDPDCDRVGVAVRDPSGGYALLSATKRACCSWTTSAPNARSMAECPQTR